MKNNYSGNRLIHTEWEDWYMEIDENYFDDVDDYCEQCEKADELEEFKSELFEQIDWDKIHRMTD